MQAPFAIWIAAARRRQRRARAPWSPVRAQILDAMVLTSWRVDGPKARASRCRPGRIGSSASTVYSSLSRFLRERRRIVASHVTGTPLSNGSTVTPSGRLPSVRCWQLLVNEIRLMPTRTCTYLYNVKLALIEFYQYLLALLLVLWPRFYWYFFPSYWHFIFSDIKIRFIRSISPDYSSFKYSFTQMPYNLIKCKCAVWDIRRK